MRLERLVLGYSVITGGEFSHRNSFDALLGPDAGPQAREKLSLERCVTSDVPRRPCGTRQRILACRWRTRCCGGSKRIREKARPHWQGRAFSGKGWKCERALDISSLMIYYINKESIREE